MIFVTRDIDVLLPKIFVMLLEIRCENFADTFKGRNILFVLMLKSNNVLINSLWLVNLN